MKLLTILFIITVFIIDGVQNAPAIHPIPLHPITAKLTSAQEPSVTTIRSSKYSWWYSSSSTQFTDLTSSSSTKTYHNSSSWYNSTGRIILRIFIYIFAVTLVYQFLKIVCKSKNQKKPHKKDNPVVVENKMYVSTIDGQREESPPSYVEIHKI